MTGEHVHQWEPVEQWGARYRCYECGVFGYHARLIDLNAVGPNRIVPYHCSEKGCNREAVAKDSKNHGRTRYWRCALHRMSSSDGCRY